MSPASSRRGGQGSILLRVIYTMLGFGTIAFVSQSVPDVVFGELMIAVAVVNVLAIPSRAGIGQLAVREASRSLQGQGSVGAFARWAAIRAVSIAGGVVGIAGFVIIGWRSSEYAWSVPFLVALIPLSLSACFEGAVRGLGGRLAGQLPEFLVRPTIWLAACVWIVVQVPASAFLSAAAIGFLLASSVACALSFLLLLRASATQAPRTRNESDGRAWGPAASRLALAGGAHTLLANWGVVALGLFGETVAAGQYRLCFQLASLGGVVLQALVAYHMPRFSIENEDARRASERSVIGVARRAFSAAVGFSLITSVLAPFVVPWLFGIPGDFLFPTLWILLFGVCMNSYYGAVSGLLTMAGREGSLTRTMTVASLMFVILSLAAVDYLGAVGVALSWAASVVYWNVALARVSDHELSIRCGAFSSGRVL